MEHFGRGLVAERLMRSLVIVKPEIGSQFTAGLTRVGIGFQLDLLILHRPPQPLDEDVVGIPTLPIHPC